MQKAKDYDWKDSNMALFGSDTEKKVSSSLILVVDVYFHVKVGVVLCFANKLFRHLRMLDLS